MRREKQTCCLHPIHHRCGVVVVLEVLKPYYWIFLIVVEKKIYVAKILKQKVKSKQQFGLLFLQV